MTSASGPAPLRNILVVDDDAVARDEVAGYLSERGFRVDVAADGEGMDRALRSEAVDLIVLDVMLRGEGGLSLCRRVREAGGPGVIIVSSAADEADRVLGLEMGADDYLAKPCSSRELLARIRAVLRRMDETRAGPGRRRRAYAFKGAVLDVPQRQLRGAEANPISLSAGEFSLLNVFLENPRQILSRHELLDMARGEEAAVFNRAVDVQICRLRRKLRTCTGEGVIKTYRGVGYIFDAEVTQA